jgi:hypothetical protein
LEVTTGLASSSPPPLAIFYDIYMAPDEGEEGVTEALGVIEEQINQIGQSYAASPKFQATIYYNTIGHSTGINSTYMHALCTEGNNITCQHLKHFEKAFEEVTLQSAQDFCQQADEDAKVIYFHSKGTVPSSCTWLRCMLCMQTF